MAQIIDFTKKTVSNAYDNLTRLIKVANDSLVLEEYFEVMSVCKEDGYFLPGEVFRMLLELNGEEDFEKRSYSGILRYV